MIQMTIRRRVKTMPRYSLRITALFSARSRVQRTFVSRNRVKRAENYRPISL